jgi:hypothetical protein
MAMNQPNNPLQSSKIQHTKKRNVTTLVLLNEMQNQVHNIFKQIYHKGIEVTNIAKVETRATPVEREYSPDANGKFGLLTSYEDNKSQQLPKIRPQRGRTYS